jgi:hypothetical protein
VNEIAIFAAGIVFLYVVYRVVGKFQKKEQTAAPDVQSEAFESGTKANLTRVLPVGMLVSKSGTHRGMVFAIEPNGVKIGRDKNKNQIIIDDKTVSREHAWIGLEHGKVIIRDINSSNGTYINSLETPRINSAELKDGDIIFIGKTGIESFRFKVG